MNKKINLLIVEDSLTQAEQLKYILEKNNYSVTHALDAKQAIKLAETQPPHLIISDVVMPEMDGYELCHFLKGNDLFKHIPVILLTSLADPSDIIKGLECGADSFITKPFNEEFLLSKINYLYLNFKLRKGQNTELGIEVVFAGKQHLINSSRMQILDLLFSTYENSILQKKEVTRINKELNTTQQQLKRINQTLEKTIDERTCELKKNQELLITLTSEVPIVLFSTDSNGIFTFSDGKGLTKLGLKPGQIVGLSAFDIYQDYPEIIDAIKLALSGKEIRNLVNVNGFFFDTLYQQIRNTYGKITGIVGVAIDVTQQRLAEEKLAESEDKFRNVFENSMLGKSITGIDGSLKVNKSFCKLTGYTREELEVKHWKEITHPDDIAYSQFVVESMLKGEKQNAHFEKRYIHKTGKIIYTDVQTTLQKNSLGEPRFFISSIMDVTAQKEAQIALQNKTRQLEISNHEKEELIATKDKLFSIIAHDLSGNFNPMLGFSGLLKDNFDSFEPPEIKRMIGTLHESINKQYQLLTNLLEWGRIQNKSVEFSPKPVKLLKSLNETIGFLQQKISLKNIQIDAKIDDGIFVLSEKQMLDTILRNLISNAIKFSFDNGKITIKATKTDTKIKVEITDYGVGISENNLEEIIATKRFLSTPGTNDEKGSGLGLILCKEIIEKQGGTIKLKSKPGEGTTASFMLPAVLEFKTSN